MALILALVFLVAAVSKSLDREGTVEQFTSLRIRQPALVALLLIPLELAIAVALIVDAPIGGIGAFALLAAMTTVLVGVLRSGREATCRCFGSLSSRPISPLTVGRNAVLLIMAGIVALA